MSTDFSLDLTRDPAAPGLVSAKLIEAWPEDPKADPKPLRAPRHDGWTPDRERLFLDTLAQTGVVADACRAVGISRDSAYGYRKRAAGRVFALAWDAAILISRRVIADDVICRARHGVVDRIYKDGQLVAERHRYDNRLTMAVLTRLDRLAEGQGEGAAVANTIAGEWDQFLDIVQAGGDGAEAFLRARTSPPQHSPRNARRAVEGPAPKEQEEAEELESSASLLARLTAYKKFEVGLPHEIRTADLAPAKMSAWTQEQWARAEFSGFLDRLPADAWPSEALSGEADGTDGMCRSRQLYLERHGAEPAGEAAVAEDEEDELANCEVWEVEDGEFRTHFPPPPGFDLYEAGEPGDPDYQRALTPAELAAIGADPEAVALEWGRGRTERLALEAEARDLYFGFTPPSEEDPM
jgi:hypothetical protein